MKLSNAMREYRIFPVLFSFFYIHLMNEVYHWYTLIVSPDVGQSGFAGAVMAAGAAWFKFYVESGNKKYE